MYYLDMKERKIINFHWFTDEVKKCHLLSLLIKKLNMHKFNLECRRYVNKTTLFQLLTFERNKNMTHQYLVDEVFLHKIS